MKIRTRFYLAVEGEGEQSFVKWIQQLSDNQGLHVHLDCQPLGGGGYQSMLSTALRFRKRKERRKAKASILLVDGDRTEFDDGWSITQLRSEATKENINVCIQNPNQEGMLLRMIPGNESLQPSPSSAHKLLRKQWPNYLKPIDARMLASRFSIKDLFRTASLDAELTKLLEIIGLH